MATKKKSSTIKIPTQASMIKKYQGAGLASNVLKDITLWLPSRFLALNHQWGGGVAYGKIVEVFGEESSGKSLISQDFGYCAQALGGVIIWVDSEKAFSKSWAEANGLDVNRIWLYSENMIESVSDFIMESTIYWRSQLTNNEPILLVIDSLAALDTIENQNSTQLDKKAEMGNRAKAIDYMLRTRNPLLTELGVCTIIINQLRSKIGASKFEDPETTPGGKATAFYASIRVGVYGGKQIKGKVKGKECRVGRVSSIRIKKNKIAPPRETIKGAEVYFHPGYSKPIGFSKYFGLAAILEDTGVLERKKNSSRYYFNDKMVANGEEALIRTLEKDDKLRRKLIRRAGINTISNTQSIINNLDRNLYPIITGKEKEEKDGEK